MDRDGGRCARCGQMFGLCSAHHRQPRGMGGSRAPLSFANLVLLCGSGTSMAGCHQHVESHRSAAYEDGWLVRRGTDPATVPLLLWDGRWVLLAPDAPRYIDVPVMAS